MTDREKIMNDFEHEVNKAHGEGWEFVDLSTDDAKKILVLLKEQEPKVITREGLKQFDERPCWFESHGTYMGEKGFWIIPYMFTCYETMSYVYPLAKRTNRGDYHVSELGLSAYNKAWRCWSSKPTDEQREAVKWDD